MRGRIFFNGELNIKKRDIAGRAVAGSGEAFSKSPSTGQQIYNRDASVIGFTQCISPPWRHILQNVSMVNDLWSVL